MADIGDPKKRVKVIPLTEPSIPDQKEPEPKKVEPVKVPEKV